MCHSLPLSTSLHLSLQIFPTRSEPVVPPVEFALSGCYGMNYVLLRTITFFLSFKIFNENSSTPRPAWGSSRRLWLTLPAAPVPHPPRPLLQLSGSAGRPGSRRRCGTRGWRGVRGGAPRLAALSRRTERSAWGLTPALPVAAAGQLAFFFFPGHL